MLVCPGNRERMVAKAATLPADEVVLDLEDGVPGGAEAKRQARRALVTAVAAVDFGRRNLAVRINQVGSREALADLCEVVPALGPRLATVVVPKVSRTAEIGFVHHVLDGLEDGFRVGIEIQIETAAGLGAVGQLASASDRLEALIFGPGDFAATMGMPQLAIGGVDTAYPGDLWHYPLYQIAVAARANGLQVVDGPYSLISDLVGLEESCRRAARLGLDGKWLIHPDQLRVINRAFTPSEEQLAAAREVLRSVGEGGASRMGQEMVDDASRRMAESVLARAGIS